MQFFVFPSFYQTYLLIVVPDSKLLRKDVGTFKFDLFNVSHTKRLLSERLKTNSRSKNNHFFKMKNLKKYYQRLICEREQIFTFNIYRTL